MTDFRRLYIPQYKGICCGYAVQVNTFFSGSPLSQGHIRNHVITMSRFNGL